MVNTLHKNSFYFGFVRDYSVVFCVWLVTFCIWFHNNSTNYEKIKKILLDIGIPEEQIAVKTAEKDDIRKQNLLSKDCEIRYIITVNTLKEGWDCPFEYILATVANRNSVVDVEQNIGTCAENALHKS